MTRHGRQRRGFRRGEQRQLPLAFPLTWGGARPGAGRKRAPRGNTRHEARPRHRAGEPVHVTLRARLAPLRSQHVFPTVRLALLRAGRRYPGSFWLLHFSVQHDHVHLVVEAKDKRSLSSGVRSIAIRIARYVNDLLSRRGPLWADRFHSRALKTPREVRNALVYVLANFRKHARRTPRAGIDPFSSGAWFDGWREWRPSPGRAPPWASWAAWRTDWNESPSPLRHTDARRQLGVAPPNDGATRRGHAAVRVHDDEPTACVVSPPRGWLARTGWRRRGLIALNEPPRG